MVQATDDRQKVEAAQADPARFGVLYEDNFYRVYAYVMRRLGRHQQAEDVTAEVFREALANIRKFEWRGVPFAAWLLKIAANAVHDHWARQARETGSELQDGDPPTVEETERRAMLFQLVARLPEAQRRVIELRFVEEKSIREAAESLGRSEGAVKQLQLRALEALRAEMEGVR